VIVFCFAYVQAFEHDIGDIFGISHIQKVADRHSKLIAAVDERNDESLRNSTALEAESRE
jgi:hypothetical protein